MEALDHLSLLPLMGIAIDDALTKWETHLKDHEKTPAYDSLIDTESKDTETKIQALKHLLDALPARYNALVRGSRDSGTEFFTLPEQCADLLKDLNNPDPDLALDDWFNKVIYAKAFVKNIMRVEKGIRDDEQERLQFLKLMKANHKGLVLVHNDGELGPDEVEKLMDAMVEHGVSMMDVGLYEEEALALMDNGLTADQVYDLMISTLDEEELKGFDDFVAAQSGPEQAGNGVSFGVCTVCIFTKAYSLPVSMRSNTSCETMPFPPPAFNTM